MFAVVYKNYVVLKKGCGMIVHETAIHQITVESKLLQVPLWPSTMNHTVTEAVKGPEIQNVKLSIKHHYRPNHLKKC